MRRCPGKWSIWRCDFLFLERSSELWEKKHFWKVPSIFYQASEKLINFRKNKEKGINFEKIGGKIQATFEKLENELREVNRNEETLKKNFSELTELKHILRKTQTFFEEVKRRLEYSRKISGYIKGSLYFFSIEKQLGSFF